MERKIVHIVLGKANPNRMNGVNKVVDSLATAQSSLGFDVAVWGITKTLVINYPQRNYETELFQDYKFKFQLDHELKAIIANTDEETIFHLHGAFLPQFYSLAQILVKHNKQYYYTPHGAYNEIAMKRSHWKKRLYTAFFEGYVARHASKIHLIGASEIVGMNKLFGSLPHCLIPNGQTIQRLAEGYVPMRRRIKDKLVIGFCGRIDIHTKGLDILLEALGKVRNEYNIPVELWVIGDDGDMKTFKADILRLELLKDIVLWGKKFGDEKLGIMRSMDYLVLNSRNEGLPGVVLEAASQATPVLVSKPTNMAAYVNQFQAGLVAEENTVDGIAEMILEAYQLKKSMLYKTMSNSALRMVKEAFDWSVIATSMVRAYGIDRSEQTFSARQAS